MVPEMGNPQPSSLTGNAEGEGSTTIPKGSSPTKGITVGRNRGRSRHNV